MSLCRAAGSRPLEYWHPVAQMHSDWTSHGLWLCEWRTVTAKALLTVSPVAKLLDTGFISNVWLVLELYKPYFVKLLSWNMKDGESLTVALLVGRPIGMVSWETSKEAIMEEISSQISFRNMCRKATGYNVGRRMWATWRPTLVGCDGGRVWVNQAPKRRQYESFKPCTA